MKQFNLRVYGILINSKNEVLVSDEKYKGIEFTKFPGGGLEWGEGTIECLKREFVEELNLEIQVDSILYLADFFQVSDFNDKDQLISIYYKISCENTDNIEVSNSEIHTERLEHHRWISLNDLSEENMYFPIDKKVVSILKESIENQIDMTSS